MAFETSTEYTYLIEKKTENFYRAFSKKLSSFPSSAMEVKENVLRPKAISLTPQESEQLSMYVSNDSYVKQQKEDIQELTQMFKKMMGDSALDSEEKPYVAEFRQAFHPIPNVGITFSWEITEFPENLIIRVDHDKLECFYGEAESPDAKLKSSRQIVDKVVYGEQPLQTAFMAGEVTVMGNFKVLHTFDTLFRFKK